MVKEDLIELQVQNEELIKEMTSVHNEIELDYLVSNKLLQSAKNEEALNLLIKIRDREKKTEYLYAETSYQLAFIHYCKQEYETALFHCNRSIKLNPEYSPAWHLKGVILRTLEYYTDALLALEKSVLLDSGTEIFKVDLAHAYCLKYKYDNNKNYAEKAEILFKNLLSINPDNETIVESYALLLIHLQKYNEAINQYNSIITINNKRYDIWCLKGEVFLKINNYKDALISFNNSLKINNSHPDAWFGKALALYNLKNWKKKECKSVEQNSKSELFSFFSDSNKNMKTDIEFSVFNTLDMSDTQIHLYRTRNGAIKSLENAISIKHNYKEAYTLLIKIFNESKKYKRAIIASESFVRFCPNNAVALKEHGKLLSYFGSNKKALEMLLKSIKIDANDHQTWQELGLLFCMTGKYSKAIQAFSTGIKLSPDNASLFYNITRTYSLLNNKNETLKHLKKCIEIDMNEKDFAKKDSFLDWLWKDPDFIEIVG